MVVVPIESPNRGSFFLLAARYNRRDLEPDKARHTDPQGPQMEGRRRAVDHQTRMPGSLSIASILKVRPPCPHVWNSG